MTDQISFGAALYFVSEWMVRITMLFWVPLRRSPEAAKGWLLLIFFLPWPGLLLYSLIGRPYAPHKRRERMDRLRAALRPTAERLAAHPHITHPPTSPAPDSNRCASARVDCPTPPAWRSR